MITETYRSWTSFLLPVAAIPVPGWADKRWFLSSSDALFEFTETPQMQWTLNYDKIAMGIANSLSKSSYDTAIKEYSAKRREKEETERWQKEQERIYNEEREKAEQKRKEQERIAREEREKAEQKRKEQERIAREEREKAEQKRKEQERIAKEAQEYKKMILSPLYQIIDAKKMQKKEAVMKEFAVSELNPVWEMIVKLKVNLAEQNRKVEEFAFNLKELDRIPENEPKYIKACETRYKMAQLLLNLYTKLEESYVAAKAFESSMGDKKLENIKKNTIEVGIKEAEMAAKRYETLIMEK